MSGCVLLIESSVDKTLWDSSIPLIEFWISWVGSCLVNSSFISHSFFPWNHHFSIFNLVPALRSHKQADEPLWHQDQSGLHNQCQTSWGYKETWSQKVQKNCHWISKKFNFKEILIYKIGQTKVPISLSVTRDCWYLQNSQRNIWDAVSSM